MMLVIINITHLYPRYLFFFQSNAHIYIQRNYDFLSYTLHNWIIEGIIYYN